MTKFARNEMALEIEQPLPKKQRKLTEFSPSHDLETCRAVIARTQDFCSKIGVMDLLEACNMIKHCCSNNQCN